ncbi:MAG: hypothetical protein AAGF36_01160 [Pseudomonadota bacterium]
METQASIQDRADRLQAALVTAFGVSGKSLAVALRRTGRRLPRRLHVEAQKIVQAQGFGGHPKRLRQIDSAALSLAETRVVTFLDGIDRADRRKGFWLGMAGAVAFNILVVVAAVVTWMWWAGHV